MLMRVSDTEFISYFSTGNNGGKNSILFFDTANNSAQIYRANENSTLLAARVLPNGRLAASDEHGALFIWKRGYGSPIRSFQLNNASNRTDGLRGLFIQNGQLGGISETYGVLLFPSNLWIGDGPS